MSELDEIEKARLAARNALERADKQMVKVNFCMKDVPGIQVREFPNEYEADRFFTEMYNDPNCENVNKARTDIYAQPAAR